MTKQRRTNPTDLTQHYKTIQIVTYFANDTYEKLRMKALRDVAAPEAYIKRILNKCISLNTTPPLAEFNRLYPLTKKHRTNYVAIESPYPGIYLRYLDELINNLPPTYTTSGRSRRRMVETLTLIELNKEA